jgi:hypothetical protein
MRNGPAVKARPFRIHGLRGLVGTDRCSPNQQASQEAVFEKGLPMLLDTGSTARLCRELRWLRSRYDNGAVAPCVYGVIKKIETEVAWRDHAKHTDPRGSADQPPNA